MEDVVGEDTNAIKLVVFKYFLPTIGEDFYTLSHKDFLPFLEGVCVSKGKCYFRFTYCLRFFYL